MMDTRERKGLRQWVQGIKNKTVVASLGAAVDLVHELLNDYDTLERITAKRTEYMRDALHAIINAADVEGNLDFPLREIAYNALVADTKLADEQYVKLEDHDIPING